MTTSTRMKFEPHLPVKYGYKNNKDDDDEDDGKGKASSFPPAIPEVAAKAGGTGYFTESFDDRLWMFHRRWDPPEGKDVKATLMILHGTVDHSGVYDEFAKDLIKHGVAVIGMDMRGFGLSDGESLYVDDVDTFVQDVDALYKHVHGLPRYQSVKSRFLLGKSLGGTVGAFCASKYPKHWTGLLGLSGGYELDPKIANPPTVALTVLQWLAWWNPKMQLRSMDNEGVLIKDEKALQSWRDDDLCCKDRIRLGYVLQLPAACREIQESIAQTIDIPMLMMWGTDDKVVTKSGHQLMLDKNNNEDKKLIVYDGGYHSLLQEPSLKERVTADIREWIHARS